MGEFKRVSKCQPGPGCGRLSGCWGPVLTARTGATGITKWNRQKYNIAEDFHGYAIEWDTDQVSWFYEGNICSTYSRSDAGTKKWVLKQPFQAKYLLAMCAYIRKHLEFTGFGLHFLQLNPVHFFSIL
jgi:hypothetical protein